MLTPRNTVIQHTSDLMQVAEDMWKLSGLGDSSDDEDGHGP